jgi:hypothetical protein
MRARSAAWGPLRGSTATEAQLSAVSSSPHIAISWKSKNADQGMHYSFGPGDFSGIHGLLVSEFFLTILNDYVLNSFIWRGMYPAESIFQQDNSRVHTANVVQQSLAEQ